MGTSYKWPGRATILREFIEVDFFDLSDLSEFTKKLDNLLNDEKFKKYRRHGPFKNMLDEFVYDCVRKIKPAQAAVVKSSIPAPAIPKGAPVVTAAAPAPAIPKGTPVVATAVAKTSKDAKDVLPKEAATGSHAVAKLLSLLTSVFSAPSAEEVRSSLNGDFSGLPGANATFRHINS